MIVFSVENITNTITSGMESAFGNMIARNEVNTLNKNFNLFEYLSFFVTTILYSSLALLIIPFISVYLKGITDSNYIRPVFADIMILSSVVFCIRYPYNSIIMASGHFKQTRNIAYIETGVNIVLSLVLVKIMGISGVVLATLIAITIRTAYYVYYMSKNILFRKKRYFIKKCLVFSAAGAVILGIFHVLPKLTVFTYYSWFVYGCEVAAAAIIISVLISLIFYLEEFKNCRDIIINIIISKLKNKKNS